MRPILDMILNIAGLLGVGLLAVPALYAEKYARLTHRLGRLEPDVDDPALKEAHRAAERNLQQHRASWSPFRSFCLLAGTALAAFSYAVGILAAWFGP